MHWVFPMMHQLPLRFIHRIFLLALCLDLVEGLATELRELHRLAGPPGEIDRRGQDHDQYDQHRRAKEIDDRTPDDGPEAARLLRFGNQIPIRVHD